MRVLVVNDATRASTVAASMIARRLQEVPTSVVGVATGSTPLGVYRALAVLRSRGLDTTRARFVALDEYVGLYRNHPQSYRQFLLEHVIEPFGADPANLVVPAGWRDDPVAAADDFEASIRSLGGVDLQVLGIGRNGHIGFNEPTSSLTSRTRLKTLSAVTRRDNARFFGSVDDVPVHCLTQGLGTIGDAREIVLVALGAAKSAAVAAAVEGPVSAFCPASSLQFHPNTTVIVDTDAASRLTLIDYYRFVEEQDHWEDSALASELPR